MRAPRAAPEKLYLRLSSFMNSMNPRALPQFTRWKSRVRILLRPAKTPPIPPFFPSNSPPDSLYTHPLPAKTLPADPCRGSFGRAGHTIPGVLPCSCRSNDPASPV